MKRRAMVRSVRKLGSFHDRKMRTFASGRIGSDASDRNIRIEDPDKGGRTSVRSIDDHLWQGLLCDRLAR
jgi:hypothetical protein